MNKRTLCVLSLSITTFALAAEPVTLPTLKKPDFSRQATYQVVRVIDGDTILVKTGRELFKVRLIGVDTPETVHPSKPVEHYGKEASLFLTNLLKGEQVYLLYEGEKAATDKYHRILAYVYRVPDGLFVNAEIIRQGYGHAYTRFPFKYMAEFRQLERFAKQAQKGLWAPKARAVKAEPVTRPPAKRPQLDPKNRVLQKLKKLEQQRKREREAAIRRLPKPLMNYSIEKLQLALILKVTQKYQGAKIYSDERKRQYLGTISDEFGIESIFNKFGTYGSEFSSKSIWNKFGSYGSKFSLYSPFNQFSLNPPLIIQERTIIGRLTINKFVIGAVDPNWLKICILKKWPG